MRAEANEGWGTDGMAPAATSYKHSKVIVSSMTFNKTKPYQDAQLQGTSVWSQIQCWLAFFSEMRHLVSLTHLINLITLLMSRNIKSKQFSSYSTNFLSVLFTLNSQGSFLAPCSIFHSKNFTSIFEMLFWISSDVQCKFPGIFSPLKLGSVFQSGGRAVSWFAYESSSIPNWERSENSVDQDTDDLWVIPVLAPYL